MRVELSELNVRKLSGSDVIVADRRFVHKDSTEPVCISLRGDAWGVGRRARIEVDNVGWINIEGLNEDEISAFDFGWDMANYGVSSKPEK